MYYYNLYSFTLLQTPESRNPLTKLTEWLGEKRELSQKKKAEWILGWWGLAAFVCNRPPPRHLHHCSSALHDVIMIWSVWRGAFILILFVRWLVKSAVTFWAADIKLEPFLTIWGRRNQGKRDVFTLSLQIAKIKSFLWVFVLLLCNLPR